MKSKNNRLISFILTLVMIVSYLPLHGIEAKADSVQKSSGGTDVLDALGINSNEAPKGYDPNSVDNPYGRNTIEITPVKELYAVGVQPLKLYDEELDATIKTGEYDQSQTGQTKQSKAKDISGVKLEYNLYGHNKWKKANTAEIMKDGDNNAIINNGNTKINGEYTVINKGDHKEGEKYNTEGYLSSVRDMSTTFKESGNSFNFAMSSVAAGNFDGNKKSLQAQTATVYAGGYNSKGGVYLRFGNTEGDPGKGQIELLSNKKEIGNPNLKSVGESANASGLVENFSENPYQLKNYLQVATGDWNGDGTDEVAVYVPELGNSRIVVYSLQITSSDDPKEAYKDASKWKVAWTYPLNEGDVVSNMVSLVSGDVDEDGIDDLACTWGYYYGPEQNKGSRAVVMFGGKGSEILKRSQEFPLNYGTSNIVRASFVFGDLAGNKKESLILCGQSDADLKAGNTYSRYVAMYNWDGKQFKSSVNRNFNLFEKKDNKAVWAAMDDKHRKGDAQSKFYSLPLCVANTAIIKRGISEKSRGDLLYFDSLVVSYGKKGLNLDEAWDASGVMTDSPNTEYVEYDAAGGDLVGKTGASSVMTLSQTLSKYDEAGVSYNEVGKHEEPVYEKESYYKNWIHKLFKHKSYRWVFKGTKTVEDPKKIDVKYNKLKPAVTKMVVVDRTGKGDNGGYYVNSKQVNSSYAICLANTDNDSSYMNYKGNHYFTYTDPKILAVLASPPYFKDLLNRDDLSGNYAESTTSYSSTKGHGSGSSKSATLTVGAYVSFAQEVSIFGIKIGQVEAEATFTKGFTWETENTSTIEQTISYNASAGEDKVAFYSIPMEIYEYTSYIPDGKGGYEEVLTTVNKPHEACVKLLGLDEYENIAKDYSVLPKVSDSVLKHEIGDPSTYPKDPDSYGSKLVAKYEGMPSSVGYTSKAGGDSISQEITMTKEKRNSFVDTTAVEAKAGAGAGGVTVGVVAGFEGGVGTVKISTEGNSFSGEMQAMPMEAKPYGYGMNWRIFCHSYKEGKTSFPVVNYAVSEVSQPSSLPEDFKQNISETTSESVTLTWSYDKFVSGFQLYRYYEFPDGGGSYKLEYVPFSSGKKESDGTYTFSYTDKGLSPYTEYKYQIQTVNAANAESTSIYSEPIVCRTKTEVGYPKITVDGLNSDGKLVIYPDSSAEATVSLENPEKYKSISYQWQRFVNGDWKNIAGAKSNKYAIINASSADNGKYRCLVNVIYYDTNAAQNYYISAYSKEFETAYSKRTTAVDFIVNSHTYGSEESAQYGGIHAQIELHSANRNNSTAPNGTVSFIITGVDYKLTKTVKLAVSDRPKTFGDESKYYSNASIDIPNLPKGAYTVNYYYGGDRVFKDAQSNSGKMVIIGKNVRGYTMVLANGKGEKLNKFTYGDVINGTVYEYGWANSEPREIEHARYFRILKDGNDENNDDDWQNFKSGSKTPDVGHYTIIWRNAGLEMSRTDFAVEPKPIKVSIKNKDNVKTQTVEDNLPVITCYDLSKEELAALKLSYKAVNSAGKEVTLKNGMDPGNYTITPCITSDAPDSIKNYDIKFASGKYTVVGISYNLKVQAEPYTDSSGKRIVGKAAINTGSGTETVDAHFTKGEAVQMIAKPDKGYEVDYWEVAVTGSNKTKHPASSLLNPNILNLNMEAAETVVKVYFKLKPLILTVGVDKGGTVSCSDKYFASGAKVKSGAKFDFTAKPEAGYHFKQWEYSEVGSNTKYLDGVSNKDGSNTLTVNVGTNTIGIKAIFERDDYKLNLDGMINAFYMKPSEVAGEPPVKTYIADGESVPGDTEITVVPKNGYKAAKDAVFKINGKDTDSGDSCKFLIKKNTTVSLETVRESFSISTEAQNGNIKVEIDGKEAKASELAKVSGGSNIKFIAHADRGYHFVKWQVNEVDNPEKTETLSVPEIGENLKVTAVFEASVESKAKASVTPATRGKMFYTIYDSYGDAIAEDVEMPAEGIGVYKGESILFRVKTNDGSMVEQWIRDTERIFSASKTYPKDRIEVDGQDINVNVILVASTQYPFYFLPFDSNGSLEGKADGNNIVSGAEIPGGSMIELTATPGNNYMVDYWTVTEGDTGVAENTEKVLEQNGTAVVDPVYIINGLGGFNTVRVHFRELAVNAVKVNDDEAGTGDIVYATPVNATDKADILEKSKDIRDGGKVVVNLKANDMYYGKVDKIRQAIVEATNDDAVVEVEFKNDVYKVTVYNLKNALTIVPKDLLMKKVYPEIKVKDITVDYTGKPLSASAIDGSATVEGNKIEGTWSFAGSPDLENANTGMTVQVKFTPVDIAYLEKSCDIKVTINKATPGGKPSYKAITSDGKHLSDAELSIGSILPVGGKIAWKLPNDTVVKNNTEYEWIYTPADTKNYNTLKGKIKLYVASGGSSGGNPPGGGSSGGGSGGSSGGGSGGSSGGGSGGISGGSGNPSLKKQTVDILLSIGEKILNLKADLIEDRAVISDKDMDDVINMINSGGKDKKLSIDASKIKQTVNSIVMPTKLIKATTGTAADKNKAIESMTVKLSKGEAEFDASALSAISSQADGKNITMSVGKIKVDKLNAKQRKAIENMDVYGMLDISVKSDKQVISDLKGGNVKVYIPFEIPGGKDAARFALWHVSDDGDKLRINTEYKDGKLSSKLGHFSEYAIAYDKFNFSDVPKDAYYMNAVAWAVEKDITKGTTKTTFSPDEICTRAQIAVFIWRAAGMPKAEKADNPFKDVKTGSYYYDALLWAYEKGIISGTSKTSFSPDAVCTRAQTVAILYRFADSPKVSTSNTFKDVESSAYYNKAVSWAVENGITSGTSATAFSPDSDCTRAQIVTLLNRYMTKK